jgi:hypothetical protein
MSIFFVCTKNKLAEEEFRKTIPFTVAFNLGIKLNKVVEVLYNEIIKH